MNTMSLIRIIFSICFLVGSNSQLFRTEPIYRENQAEPPNQEIYYQNEEIFVPYGNDENEIGYQLGKGNVLPMGPNAISLGPDGKLYILDSINHRILSVQNDQNVIFESNYDTALWITDISMPDTESFYLLDSSQGSIIRINYSGVPIDEFDYSDTYDLVTDLYTDIEGNVLLTGYKIAGRNKTIGGELQRLTSSFHSQDESGQLTITENDTSKEGTPTRLGVYELILIKEGTTGIASLIGDDVNTSFPVNVPQDQLLGGITLLEIDEARNFYIQVDAILQEGNSAISINSFIIKVDQSGNLLAIVDIDDNYFTKPYHPIAVDKDGVIYHMVTDSVGVHVIKWSNQIQDQNQRLPVFTYSKQNQKAQFLREQSIPVIPQEPIVINAVTRDQIISTAESYRSHVWTVGNNNYYGRTCDGSPQCPVGNAHWSIGTTVTGVAYQWGGEDSVSGFDSKLSQGYIAGDVTGTECEGSCATGVDCSGFVTNTWQSSRFTTSSINNVATAISVNDIQRGDAFNSASVGHVVLFSYYDGGGIPVYYESQWTAARVILNSGWNYINGYTAYRYNDITGGTDTTPPDGNIDSPSENQTVNNRSINISGWVSDSGTGVNRAHVTATWAGSDWHVISSEFNSNFSFNFDLCNANVPNGQVTLGLDIWDNAGNVSYSPRGARHFTKNYTCSTPPSSPSLSIPANGSFYPATYDLTFLWNSSSGASEYLIEWWGGPYTTMQPCGWSSSTSCHIGTVAAGNTYSWHVRARNSAGESDWSSTWTFTIQNQTQPPPAPALSNPSNGATLNRSDSVNLIWNTSTNATSYYAEFWGGPNLNLNSGWITGTNWSVGSQWGGGYQWRVRARNSDVEGPWSEIRTLIIRYGAPSLLAADPVSSSQINLAWFASADAPGNIDGYRIYRNGTSIGTVGSTVTTYQDSGLASGTTYSYTVRAYRGTVESDPSNTAQAATHGGAPAAPEKFRFTDKTESTLTMSWDDVSNETGYRIFEWNGESFVLAHTVAANITSFTDNGFKCGETYFYELAAYNGEGESPHAGWISDTTTECLGVCPDVINYWKGEYWTNVDFAGSSGLCRDDFQLNFNWEDGSPTPAFPDNEFSARWTRDLYFPENTYRFHFNHDDDGRIFVDDDLRFDGWGHCCSWEEADIAISGGNHNVRVEMTEYYGGAHLMLWWEPLFINGWRGEYYNNMNLEGNPAIVRDDFALAFDWGLDSPDPLVSGDNFSARWTRTIDFPEADNYRFHFYHDNGGRIYIDGNLAVDLWEADWGWHDADVWISAGSHEIRVEMFEVDGGARAWLWWEPLSINGWRGEYYNNMNLEGDPAIVRDDAVIDFDWYDGSPHPLVRNDNFSVRWTRTLDFTAGEYTFTLFHDNGARLYIDDQLLLENWCTGCVEEDQITTSLTAGQHTIRYEMLENEGSAAASLSWTQEQDSYEPDNSSAEAKVITPGQPQTHSITPNGDVDWIRFTVSQESNVVLESSGSTASDTEMYLYNSSLSQVEYDDDDGSGNYALIDRTCGTDPLATGTYYARVNEYGDNATIPEYQIALTVQPCAGSFAKLAPTNGATGQSTSLTLDWANSANATSYEYCYDTTDDAACSNWVSTGTTSQATISGLANSATYYWQVRANNQLGSTYADNGTWWNFSTSGNPPGVFDKVNPQNGAVDYATRPTLRWDSSLGASRYEYCIDTTNDNACSNWISTGTETSIMVMDLANNTTYYWQVRAVNSSGTTYANGAANAYWNFRTIPPPPVGFNKVAPTNGQIDQQTSLILDWENSVNAARYEYCYDTTNDNACTNWVSTGTTSQVSVSGLNHSTTYYWQSRAVNSAATTYANGSETAFWSFTTQAPIVNPPGAFNRSSPTNNATDQPINPTLDWGDSTGATSYEYCYDTTNDSSCSNWVSTGSTSQVTLSGLSYSTNYYWHVRAVNSGGTTYANGSTNTFWRFTTGDQPVSLPGAFNKSAPQNGATNQPISLSLDWADSTGATAYEYCYDTTNDNNCSNWIHAGTTSQASISGLSYSTVYYWQVRANNSAGTTYANVNANAYWSFTTQVPPGTFAKSAPANAAQNQQTNLTLDWNDSAGATNYEYCYDNTNDNSCSSWTSSGSTSQVNVSGLSNATTYYWQVRAINSAGTTYANGSATAFWSFTTGAPVDGVILAVNPASQTAALGQNFTVEIQVRAGTRQVDGASAYINFNPAHLNVVSITPGTVFTNTLENTHDNAIGQLNFSAGSLSNFPTGTFTLATITFRPLVQVSQTTLTFNSVNPRKSDATFGGASILGSTVNGTVTINQSSTINASVNLQGRPAKPDPSWSVPLTVDLTLTGQTTPRYRFTPTSDNRGAFTLTDVQPGSYRVAVKNGHTLHVVQNITVQTGTNTAEFGPLPEGDANNDNYVTLLDFSILASTYGRSEGGQGFDGRADFNEDNYITLLDFSLLATNFGDSGSAVSGLNTQAIVGAAPGQYANLIMEPGSQQIQPGETFKVAVMVESGDNYFDSAQASINFDPALLQVVALKGNTTAFPMALLNDFNNTLGTIDYAAGAVDNFPHGRVQLVEIEFRAKSTEGTTAITFNKTGVRKSDVAFAGNSVLANIESASILIGTKQYFFVPLVEFGK